MTSSIDSDTGITEKVYATSEVARIIGIAPVTVRKYSQELENKGYVFIRSKIKGRQKARLYRYSDVESLRYLKEIREESNITVDQATSITVERLGKGAIQSISSTDTEKTKRYSNQYDELKDMIQKQGDRLDKQNDLLVNQSELILNLTDKIDQQDKYISKQLASPEYELKKIEVPKEIQTLKNIKIPKLDEAPKEIEEDLKEVEEPPKESPSRRSKKDKKKSLFSKILDKLIIDTRNNK